MFLALVDGKAFSAALGKVARAAARRSYVEILNGVRLHADGSTLTLSCTDLDVRLLVQLEADVKQAGTLVVSDVKRFAAAVKGYAGEVVLAETNRLTVTCGSSLITCDILPSDDWPMAPELADVPLVATMSLSTLLGTYAGVEHAVSGDDSRPVLTGCHFRLEGDSLRLSATDSYRLAVETCSVWNPGEGRELIIPGRAIGMLGKVVKDLKGEHVLTIRASAKHAFFSLGSLLLTVRVIEGQFPDVDRLRPPAEGFAGFWAPDVAATVAALGRLDKAAEARNNPVRVTLGDCRADHVTALELGGGLETVSAEYNGDPMTAGYNAGFLRDAFASFGSCDHVTMSVISPLRPAVFANGNAAGSWRLLMPIRLAV